MGRSTRIICCGLFVGGCHTDVREDGGSFSASAAETGGSGSAASHGSSADSAHDEGADSSASVDDGALFDVPAGTAEGGTSPLPSCEVTDDMNGVGDCEQEAPPD